MSLRAAHLGIIELIRKVGIQKGCNVLVSECALLLVLNEVLQTGCCKARTFSSPQLSHSLPANMIPQDYIFAVAPLLEDALMDRDLVHRQTAAAVVQHISLGVAVSVGFALVVVQQTNAGYLLLHITVRWCDLLPSKARMKCKVLHLF